MKIKKYIVGLIFICLSLVYAQDSNLSNMYRLAKTFEQSGQFEQAKNIYENIYKAQPYNTTFLEALNNIYIILKDYDKSIDLMTKNIQSSPGNVNYYGLLGNTYYTKGDTANAFNAWENGLNISKSNSVVYRVIINYALENRAFNKAIEYLNRGKKFAENADIFSLDLARVYAMTMNFDKAAIEFCEIIKNDPQKMKLVFGTMTSFLTRPNALEETIKTVEEYAEENNSPEIFSLLIHLFKLNNDFENAFEYVEELESISGDNGNEYFQFAQQALAEKKYSISSKSFEKMIDEYPNSPLVPPARIGYAKTFEESINTKRDTTINSWKEYSKTEVVFENEYKEAIKSYKKIYELYPNNNIKSEAVFRIAEIYFEKLDQPDSALFYFNQINSLNTTSQFKFESDLRVAEIKLRNGEIEAAEKQLEAIVNNSQLPAQFNSKANLLLGKVYFWKGKLKASSQKFVEVTKNLFDDYANDALQTLTLISTLKSDSLSLANYAAAEYIAYKGDFPVAADRFQELAESNNPIIKELSGLKYAQMLVAEDNYNSALEVLATADDNSSLKMFDPEIQYLSGEIRFYAIKDYDGALSAYWNVLENYSNSLYFDKARQKIEFINEMKKKPI